METVKKNDKRLLEWSLHQLISLLTMFADALRMLLHWRTFRPSRKQARLNHQVIQAKEHFPCCHPCAPAPLLLVLMQQVQKHTSKVFLMEHSSQHKQESV